MNNKDIEGSKARMLHPIREKLGPMKVSQMDYRDVTHVQFKTSRHTNPLDPTYTVRADEDKNVCDIGPIRGGKPNVLPPPRQDKNF